VISTSTCCALPSARGRDNASPAKDPGTIPALSTANSADLRRSRQSGGNTLTDRGCRRCRRERSLFLPSAANASRAHRKAAQQIEVMWGRSLNRPPRSPWARSTRVTPASAGRDGARQVEEVFFRLNSPVWRCRLASRPSTGRGRVEPPPPPKEDAEAPRTSLERTWDLATGSLGAAARSL